MDKQQKKIIMILDTYPGDSYKKILNPQIMGVYLEDTKMNQPSVRNGSAFQIDKDIYYFNECLLKKMGLSWDRIDPIVQTSFFDREFSEERRFAKELLNKKFIGDTFYALNTRGMALCLPFWQEIFKELQIEDSYLISLTNPFIVAGSLKKQESFTKEKGLMLWAQYAIMAVQNTQDKQRCFVSYDDVLANPWEQLIRIEKELSLCTSVEAEVVYSAYIDEFLSMNLSYYKSSDEIIDVHGQDFSFVQDLYFLLKSLTNINIDINWGQFNDSWSDLQKHHLKLLPILSFTYNLEKKSVQMLNELDTLKTNIVNAEVTKISLEQEVKLLHQAVLDRDNSIKNLKNIDLLAQERNDLIQERDELTQKKDELIQERDTLVQERNELIQERVIYIQEKNELIQGRDTLTQVKDKLIEERHVLTQEKDKIIEERDVLIQDKNMLTHERDIITQERGILIQDRVTLAQERDDLLVKLETALYENLEMKHSTSWKITKPIRMIKKFVVIKIVKNLRMTMSRVVRLVWRRLPISDSLKKRIKSVLFSRGSFLFSWSITYRNFKNSKKNEASFKKNGLEKINQQRECENDYVPLLCTEALKNPPVNLIAFYLPQFHQIAENDKWWGEGFTEWANVKPAKPQFEGHYQPHVPGELGYYNLLDIEIQKRQVELAKLYGVGGFCFYYYWFNGKRLLEKPVENYLNNKDLDLPFCLCWANENWTRRWDGMDNEILMAQNHSPQDDIKFIESLKDYLNDSRYIRVDGKPLIIIYRPLLLPSAQKTAQRWRKWCRENGIGEIHLASTLSVDTIEPHNIGFDSVIEFPPNNSNIPEITSQIYNISHDFSGKIYDLKPLMDRSLSYKTPDYIIFRGVCPSWDNTPRRKNNGTILFNSSPKSYEDWIYNAIKDTINRIKVPENRFVFINAWNEWAEGAYLEPDRRFGYAFLSATRNALERAIEDDHSRAKG